MELTVKELLHDAILYDVPKMAYTVYYAVQKGFVRLDDLESRIPFEQLDHDAISEMMNENCLRMCTVKLFAVPIGGKQYAVYLAESVEEVRRQHFHIYGRFARRVRDVSHKMDVSIYCEVKRKSHSFRELKWKVLDFPYHVGVF